MPKILIVENSHKLSELIAKFLRKKGMDADISNDGMTAIRFFLAETYDLLLVNRELPMMDGSVFCKRIREQPAGKEIPIIMMSGLLKQPADIAILKKDLRLSGFLTRPFTVDVLLSSIASSLGISPAVAPPLQAQPEPQPGPQPEPPSAPRVPVLKDSLEKMPFEQVLFYLFENKKTGILTLTRDSVDRTYFLINGAVTDVELAPGDKDFGDYLAGKKLVEPPELREYKERRKQDKADHRDLFVKMGCLTPLQFQEESRNFLLDRLLESFAWKTGSFLFEPSPSVMKTFPSAAVFMPALFYLGFHHDVFAAAVRSFISEKGRLFPVRTAEFFEYQNHLSADAAVTEALELCDGTRSCSELLGSTDAEDSAVLLYTLEYLKGLTFSETPVKTSVPAPFPLRERMAMPAAESTEKFEDLRGELSELTAGVGSFNPELLTRATPVRTEGLSALEGDLRQRWDAIKDKNYYEMFGLTQNTFSFDKLKKAYFEFTKAYGPEKFFASSSEVMGLAEEMLSKISNAFETLTNVVSKENYDELLASQEKAPEKIDDKRFYEQIQFQSGKVFVEQGQYDNAEKAFTNCLNIEPDKSEYLAYLALAIYHNPANRGNLAAIKRAKDLVNKSLQKGRLSIAYALKGTIYLDEGGINFAEAEFFKALRLNPNNKTALKKLELIKTKREEEKKGIFQRIFK